MCIIYCLDLYLSILLSSCRLCVCLCVRTFPDLRLFENFGLPDFGYPPKSDPPESESAFRFAIRPSGVELWPFQNLDRALINVWPFKRTLPCFYHWVRRSTLDSDCSFETHVPGSIPLYVKFFFIFYFLFFVFS